MTTKKLAASWLLSLVILSGASRFFQDTIQAHELSRSLHLFCDVFGRNMFLLTLNAIFGSFLSLLPFSFLYLIFGSGAAIGLSLLPKNNLFVIFLQSVIDTLSALPGLLIGLAMSAVGKGSFFSVFAATLIMILPHLVRFFESHITHFKSQSFYLGSEALGASTIHLSRRHLFPELLSLGTAIFPFILSRLLYIETTLSFLGVGTVSDTETWGQLINQSREYLLEAPWMILIAGLPLLFTLWSFHLLTHRDSS